MAAIRPARLVALGGGMSGTSRGCNYGRARVDQEVLAEGVEAVAGGGRLVG